MDDQNLKDLEREQADNELIGNAFQHLLNTYLSSRHRKKVDIVTKAFNFARQAHKGVRRLSGEPYTLSQWHRSLAKKWDWALPVSVQPCCMT